jgi:virginiamycin B lyase
MTAAGMFTRIDLPQTNIGPVGIAAGPDGNIWYTGDLRIGQIQPTGGVREFTVPGGHDAAAITGGPENKVWFTEPIAGQIASATTAGMFAEFKIPTDNAGPFGITAGPDGNLWFTEQNASSNKIGRMTPAGVFTEWPVPTPAASPYCITPGPDGNMWFTERDGHRIGRITPAGVITEFVIPSGASPGPIVAGPDGNLWFCETKAADALGRITPSGFIAEYALPTPNSDSMGLTAGPDNALFFTEQENNKIAKITNLMGGGNVAPGLKPVPAIAAPTPCTNDTDCIGSGKACGGDVCSSTTHTCALANTHDPGTCASAANCWCMGAGATCDGTTHHCSITSAGHLAPLPDGGVGK